MNPIRQNTKIKTFIPLNLRALRVLRGKNLLLPKPFMLFEPFLVNKMAGRNRFSAAH